MPPGTRDPLITAADAAAHLRTTIPVILMWRNRGWLDDDGHRHHLPVAGNDWRGRPVYHLSDLLAAERGTRRTRDHGRHGGSRRLVQA